MRLNDIYSFTANETNVVEETIIPIENTFRDVDTLNIAFVNAVIEYETIPRDLHLEEKLDFMTRSHNLCWYIMTTESVY